MSLLTEQEIEDLYYTELDRRELSFARAIETKVIEKIKAQGPDMLYHGKCIDCGEYGHPNVEVLKLIPAWTKLYRLPEGD